MLMGARPALPFIICTGYHFRQLLFARAPAGKYFAPEGAGVDFVSSITHRLAAARNPAPRRPWRGRRRACESVLILLIELRRLTLLIVLAD